MVQGARTKNDVGLVVLFSSPDKIHWKIEKEIQTSYDFGYMWECPDYYSTGGCNILSASVQGLSGGIWSDRNVYQSGYFLVNGDLTEDFQLSSYHLWDYGFDYYAPQSFQTEDGRRILIAWMGMPDCEEYGNQPTIDEGWQHCFTFPREVFVKDGRICQRPVQELYQQIKPAEKAEHCFKTDGQPAYLASIHDIQDNHFRAQLCEELILEYHQNRFQMRFTHSDKHALSAGRGIRYLDIDRLENVTILADISSVEVFINDGEAVFSTRYYPKHYSLDIQAKGAQICFSELK